MAVLLGPLARVPMISLGLGRSASFTWWLYSQRAVVSGSDRCGCLDARGAEELSLGGIGCLITTPSRRAVRGHAGWRWRHQRPEPRPG